MLEKIISFFVKRHLLTNFITIAIYLGGILFWTVTPKEELPDMQFNFLIISTAYPGASPEEVEHFVTRPIEEEIKGIDNIYRIVSTSGVGSSSITIEIDDKVDDLKEVVNDISDAVDRVNLPIDIKEDPLIRQFKTSQKAIIDIAIVNKKKEILDNKSRRELQKYSLSLEDQVTNLNQVSSVRRRNYLKQEFQILASPDKLKKYNISINNIYSIIKNANVREPAGNIEDKDESKVTLNSELNNVKKLQEQIIRGGFEGQEIRLKNLASVKNTFEKSKSITKINGYEGVLLNVVKSSSVGIIDAVDSVKKRISNFKKYSLKDKSIDIYLLDDESRDVRNRLSLISMNGAIGFTLILISLLFFLNIKAGFWVAMGIPFSFCFTMIISYAFGYTINNVTLAAVIIVMGMIVDDAIVVAENISRLKSEGYNSTDAAVKGTKYVFLPIVASIVTTCVAFIPMLLFQGRFAKFIHYIPPIITMMLMGSLIESVIILPSHMNLHLPNYFKKIIKLRFWPIINIVLNKTKKKEKRELEEYRHWFHSVENYYGKVLEKALHYKLYVFTVFISLLILSFVIFSNKMKFIMFPNEEAKEILLTAEAEKGTKKKETARLAGSVESIFKKYLNNEVVGYRTYIAQSRFGRVSEENKFITRVEIISREKRKKSLKQLKSEWQQKISKIKNLNKINFMEHRFGQSSGSPIEIIISENDDNLREKVVKKIYNEMIKYEALSNVEIDRPIKNPEYKINLNRDKINRLGINASNIASTLRLILEGKIIYELTDADDEIDVKLTATDKAKSNIQKVLRFPVENASNYLVPINEIVKLKRVVTPYSIIRENYKRITKIYAGIAGKENLKKNLLIKKTKESSYKKKNKKSNVEESKTPLEIAEYLERKIFPVIKSKFPTTIISFGGEIKDTRESRGDFKYGIIIVLFLIYSILAILFNSLIKPFIIMAAIPFGVVGIIFAFWLHGITQFGFFAAIGALGLSGVVVNDSIVMISKLEREYDLNKHKEFSIKQIANIAKTRLRAVILTTLTTVAGLLPTAYGIAGYDSMLAEMMFSMAWGLLFATFITLILIPSLYSVVKHLEHIICD